jgi:hypothetical protein
MRFDKDSFNFDGEYLSYNRKFVARFKRTKGDRSGFVKFLIEKFTVEEYFEKAINMAPFTILETKGYVSKSAADLLIRSGYLPTPEGKHAMLLEIASAHNNSVL